MSVIRLQNLAIAYIVIWSISPPLFSSAPARLLVLVATVVWCVLEVMRHDGLARRTTLPVLMALLFIGYTGIIEFMLYGAEGLIRGIQIWILLFFLIVWQSRRNDPQSLVSVFWMVLTIYPVWLFITLWTLATVNSHAARIIVRSDSEALALMQQGVGGYSLVYGTLLLLPALIGLVRRRGALRGAGLSRPLRAVPILAYGLVVLNLVLSCGLILTAGFSIAIIALAGILISVIFLGSFSTVRMFVFAFGIVVFSILYNTTIEVVLTTLQPFAEGTSFAVKIRDTLASLQYSDAQGTVQIRMERYLRSIVLFIGSPIFGVLAWDDVGKHSQILDSFARWGLFVGSAFVYLLVFPVARIMRGNKRNFGVGLSMLAAIAVIFGLNNGFAAAGVMLYIMLPVSLHVLRIGPIWQGIYDRTASHA